MPPYLEDRPAAEDYLIADLLHNVLDDFTQDRFAAFVQFAIHRHCWAKPVAPAANDHDLGLAARALYQAATIICPCYWREAAAQIILHYRTGRLEWVDT